jgi:hypothetical protein
MVPAPPSLVAVAMPPSAIAMARAELVDILDLPAPGRLGLGGDRRNRGQQGGRGNGG